MQPILQFLEILRGLKSFPQTINARANPIKIAIIDTGVSLFDLPAMIHKPEGRSFVEDSEVPNADFHWHSPQCSHGTKLAQLIIKCNPHCKLYVAKVQSGPTANSVD